MSQDNYLFSIITPIYNMLESLKLCHASIIDQNGVNFEHIVVDGNSTDGSKEWLKQNNIKGISEPDRGMYDAINKGLKMAVGDIISYLNSDEQYLPNTLLKVKIFFENNPNIDIVFGHSLIVDPKGKLVSFRKAYRPSYNYIINSILYNLSCTMFFRRKIIDSGYKFNDNLRYVGDADFVLRILKNGYKASYINEYLSIFTWSGNNMSTGENAQKEHKQLKKEAPLYINFFSPFFNFFRILEKIFSGAYFQKFPLHYSMYLPGSKNRVNFQAKNATFRWPR